jgi:hypothetical protein
MRILLLLLAALTPLTVNAQPATQPAPQSSGIPVRILADPPAPDSSITLPATRLTSRVVDPEGNPIAGATVVLTADSTPGRVQPETWTVTTVTDKLGQFQTPDVPAKGAPGETIYYFVRLIHPAFASGTISDRRGVPRIFTLADISSNAIPLVMYPGVTAIGKVTSPVGYLPGARVFRLSSPFDRQAHLYPLAPILADAKGYYSVGPLTPGSHYVLVCHPDYAPQISYVDGSLGKYDSTVHTQLQPGLPIHARFLDEHGHPLQDASATVTTWRRYKMSLLGLSLLDARLDKAGRLTWEHPPQEAMRINITFAQPGQPPQTIPVILAPSQAEYTLRFNSAKRTFDVTPPITQPKSKFGLGPSLEDVPRSPHVAVPTAGRWVTSSPSSPEIPIFTSKGSNTTLRLQGLSQLHAIMDLGAPIDTRVYPLIIIRYHASLTRNGKPTDQSTAIGMSLAPLLSKAPASGPFNDTRQHQILELTTAAMSDKTYLDGNMRELILDTRHIKGLTGKCTALGLHVDATGIPSELTVEITISDVWLASPDKPLPTQAPVKLERPESFQMMTPPAK